MLWLGDAVDKVSRGRPALQILFFMIAAEAVAKLANAYKGESDSRKYAKQFFLTICSEDHRRLLGKAFRDPTGSSGGLSPAEAVDFLRKAGFRKILNLKGGILAWSDEVDPSVPKY